MRNKILLIMLVVFPLLNGCTNADTYVADTDFNFPFEVEVTTDTIYYVNKKHSLSLVPKQKELFNDKKFEYKVSYDVNNSSNVKMYNNRGIMKLKEQYLLENENFDLIFSKDGTYNLSLSIENQYGHKKIVQQNIVVESTAFIPTVNPESRVIDQNSELNFNIDVVKSPKEQVVTFKVLADKKQSIDYIKYNDRVIALGDEVIYDTNNLVIGFSQPNDVQLSFEFKNEDNVRVVRNIDIKVLKVDYQTEIVSRVVDPHIIGYTSAFYLNPVKISVDVTSLLPVGNLEIKISNSALLEINGVIAPDTYFRLPSNNNQFILHFDDAINGNVRNNIKITVKDNYGNITEQTLNVPINKKPDVPIINDFTNSIRYDKSSRRKGYTVHNLWIEIFTIKTSLNLQSVVAKYDFTSNNERRTTIANFNRISADTYEVTVFPDPVFYYYNNDHNDDWGDITIIAVDEIGQQTSRKITMQIR